MSAALGTCSDCGQELIITPNDCWHPHTVQRACPPEPGPGAPQEEWSAFFAKGNRCGRPGRSKFVISGDQ